MADKLILCADLGRLKAYRLSRDEMSTSNRLELINDIEMTDAHGKLLDKVTDKAGRFPMANVGTTNYGGMSIGENHNLPLELEKRLIEQIATGINGLVGSANGTTWYLAAPSTINQRLLDGLKPEVRAKLVKNVPADLVKIDKRELLDHFP